MKNHESLKVLCQGVYEYNSNLTFNILEIGALPLGSKEEPFYQVVKQFPGSKLIAFEVEKELCDELNSKADPGFSYYPVALGKDKKDNRFYITNHPMCCSLYEPNEELLRRYNNLEVACLKSVDTLETQSLDSFIKNNDIGKVDFIKIDIQGAENDVFLNGTEALKSVLGIVCEVEFIPLYKNQPLFGDITNTLSDSGLMFHKFINLASRSLKPIVMNNNPNIGSQHMWADAFYIKDIASFEEFDSDKLIKLAILAFIYGSFDLTFYCFTIHDEKFGSDLISILKKVL